MGLIRGVARTAVISGTATAVSNRVSRHQAGRWARQDQGTSTDQTQTKIDQLKSLADLKAQGILTEEEFQAQKNAILNG
jgi:hypothetical protein